MMARQMQRDHGQEPEVVVIAPLLRGLDGVQKMSKSLRNYVGIDEPAEEMFGKLMSLPDALIPEYMELCTRLPQTEIEAARAHLAGGHVNPRDLKLHLAAAVVGLYHGAGAGAAAQEAFLQVFSRRGLPEEMPEAALPGAWAGSAVDLLVALELAPSRSAARRLVEQGGMELDGVRVTDPAAAVAFADGAVLRAGKRAFRRLRTQGPG
jgi:tyrosyl-tRNA synthetase